MSPEDPDSRRPRDLTEGELGFARRQKVQWLSPRLLVTAAAKVVVSGLFGSYADKRELQGTFAEPLLECHADAGELWFDFVADLGDGFDATYTVAWLLAQDKLDVLRPDGLTEPLPHGSMLLMGGDEVYPTASTRQYEDRTKGPYRAALPEPDPVAGGRMLLSLPGNHDWYDGLTSYLRVFCQGRAIGGWQTAQPRSYFAVRLPHRWWLLGLDIQLGGYIDGPQLEFFTTTVREQLRPGDSVIVATGKPSWVDTGRADHHLRDADAFNQLDYLDRHVVQAAGAQTRMWVTGDSHHYVRYQELDGDRQLVTCGLGGAYLSATHDMPASLQIPPEDSRVRDKSAPVTYARAEPSCPTVGGSRRMGKRVWLIPWRNRGFVPLLMGVQAALVAVLTGALAWTTGRRPVSAVRDATAADLGTLAGGLALLLGLVAVAWLVTAATNGGARGRERPRPTTSVPFGVLAGCQLALALGALVATTAVPIPAGRGFGPLAVGLLTWAGAAVVAGAAGSVLFSLWLLVFEHVPAIRGWIFSGQGLEEPRGFLRMHLARDGTLTVHPVVVDEICREWQAAPDAQPGAPWITPAGPPPRTRLVEPPFTITRAEPSA